MLILNGHLMEIANATLTATPGLAATMTAVPDGLAVSMSAPVPGEDLVDSYGNQIATDDNDLFGASEQGVLRLSATLSEIILSRGVME